MTKEEAKKNLISAMERVRELKEAYEELAKMIQEAESDVRECKEAYRKTEQA